MSLSDYVIEAANYDAPHQHDEAVNSLARGVKAGDVESMTRLGKRLLAGDSAPYLPRDGARFLVDAAKAGGAEAPAILAVLSAAGAHVKQSWNEGLSAFVLAAERGWQPARDQLCRSRCRSTTGGSGARACPNVHQCLEAPRPERRRWASGTWRPSAMS